MSKELHLHSVEILQHGSEFASYVTLKNKQYWYTEPQTWKPISPTQTVTKIEVQSPLKHTHTKKGENDQKKAL